MTASGISVALALAPSYVARAACSPDVIVTSSVEVCLAGNCGSDFGVGNPAYAQRSYAVDFTNPSYDFTTGSVLAIDNGYFDVSTEASGSQELLALPMLSPLGATVDALGSNNDCFTFGGAQGVGIAHIPIRLIGSASIGWSFGGAYVAPAWDPALIQLQILCAVYDYGAGGGPIACNDPSFQWTANAAIDTTIDLAFPFTFGVPITVSIGPRVDSRLAAQQTEQTGTFAGFARLELYGEYLPLYVTDGGGTPLPNATLTAASGYDYFHPTPEPGGSALRLVALGALASLSAGRLRASR